MNAYKLAEHLEKANYMGAITSADMLRQQADRIAELEKELKRTQVAWQLAENFIEQLEKDKQE